MARRFLDGGQPSLEAQVANLADEIAYNNHDIDDGIRARLLDLEQLREVPLFARHHDEVLLRYPQATPKQMRHETVRRIIGTLVDDLVQASRARLQAAALDSPQAVRAASQPLIGYSPELAEDNRVLKRFLREQLYQHQQVYRVMQKAKRLLRELFEAFMTDARLLPPQEYRQAQRAELADGEQGRARIVADYIAGMTDRYALDEWERLFDPRRLR